MRRLHGLLSGFFLITALGLRGDGRLALSKRVPTVRSIPVTGCRTSGCCLRTYESHRRMIGELTKNERQAALIILVALAVSGLAMAFAGRDDQLSWHGALVILAAFAGISAVGYGYDSPEPTEERHHHYYDDPTKAGIIIAMGWAVFGLFIGDWVAWLLVYPELTFDAAWSSFGRLRPVHTTAVIFGFGGNALIATSLYVLQRTSRARLPDQLSPWFVLLGYNLFCVVAVTGYMMGITQSKEYAEPEWYADIWLVIVWVVYFIIYLRTLARRRSHTSTWPIGTTWPSSWSWPCCTSSTISRSPFRSDTPKVTRPSQASRMR